MNQNLQSIAAWLLAALTHWTPMPAGKLADSVNHEREVVAQALVEVAYDPAEPPLPTFANGNDSRAQTALLLGSIAAHESGLLPRLARGECMPAECDHHASFGLWQVKYGDHGLALIPGGGYRRCGRDTQGCYIPSLLIDDIPGQLRVALHVLRSDGLKSYTGEANSDTAPAARRRRLAAEMWAARHPPPLPDNSVMASAATGEIQ